MRWLVFIVVLLTGGCGVGYGAPEAVSRLEFTSIQEMTAASGAIRAKFESMGFKSERESDAWPDTMFAELPDNTKWRMKHTVTLWRHRGHPIQEDLHGRLITYPSAEDLPNVAASGAMSAHYPFLELHISEFRPGGFSPAGLKVYADVETFLRQQNYKLAVVSSPPVDEKEHDRIVLMNQVATATWWLIIWIIGTASIGSLADWGLRTARLPRAWRRAALVGVCVLLVTPFFTPTDIVVLIMPNLFIALGGPADYEALYGVYGFWLPVAFVVSFCLSLPTAFYFIRIRRNTSTIDGHASK